MRLGVDFGGTKIEVIALDAGGAERGRWRTPTPRGRYSEVIEGIANLVEWAEADLAGRGELAAKEPGGAAVKPSLGVAMPGTLSPATGLAMNANATEINGKPFGADLEKRLQRPIRFANDANCLAVSEAVDGAGAGKAVVFAAVLGTGVGGGIAVEGKVRSGLHGIMGEWGHNSLPWPSADEVRGASECFCGRRGCLETWISGPAFARQTNLADASMVVKAVAGGDISAQVQFGRFVDRLARALANVVNFLDPDVIVLGGGLSKIDAIYPRLPLIMSRYVFADRFSTPVVPALHGDSSGVRGAAWLWEDVKTRLKTETS